MRAVNPGVVRLSPAQPTFFPPFNKSHYDKRHSSSTNGLTVYVEKKPVAWTVVLSTGVRKPGNTWVGELGAVI